MSINDASCAATLATTRVHLAISRAVMPLSLHFISQNIKFAAAGIAGDFHHTLVILSAATAVAAHFAAKCSVYGVLKSRLVSFASR